MKKKYFLNINKNYIYIFFLFFTIRFIFYILSPYDNFELLQDSYWYSEQSDDVLNGNFNLLRPLFITAPFFSYFQALIKFFFNEYWHYVLTILQILISSISGIYFFKLVELLFKNIYLAIFSTILFCFYPLTMWLTFTFTQDIWFQSFLIIFIYFFNYYLIYKNKFSFFISALIFSITYLTKSHILLFSPFIVISIFLTNLNIKKKFISSALFALITFIPSIPYGIYNLKVNDTYVISSSGLGGTFITGHNEEAYLNHLKKDSLTKEQILRFKNVKYKIFEELKPKLANAKPNEIQKIYFEYGLKWVIDNPKKSLELAFYNFKQFMLPGLNKFWYPFNIWLISLIITAPIYLFAYIEILSCLQKDFRKFNWILGLFLSMLFFTTVFYYSGRFKVITLEVFYLMFFSKFVFENIKKFLTKK